MSFFLLFGRVGVFIFLLSGPGACFFCCLGRWRGFFFFCCLGGDVVFLLFGRWACFIFCCLGAVCGFFAVWAGDVFFFAVRAGNGSSFTFRSAWLVFKRPDDKKDQTAKKKMKHAGSPFTPPSV